MNNPLKEPNGDITRYTGIKVNIASAIAIVVAVVSGTFYTSSFLNEVNNQISHIVRTQKEFTQKFQKLAEDSTVSDLDFKRPDALFYCREIAEANRIKYPDLKCPDPYKIPKWRP